MVNKTTIIAEAGVNHNGSLDLARELIDVAAEAGADYVKFQTFEADKITSKQANKAKYQQNGSSESQWEMLKKLELRKEDHVALINYCREKNIRFLSTPFDLGSIDLLKELGVNLGKIPSGEITNLPYLRRMAESFESLVMSTGMADMEDIAAALGIITRANVPLSKITLLHCNTAYPTPFHDVNLLAMPEMANKFGVAVGYSDHTPGVTVPIAAVALGATMIEKHFTLNKNMDGPDHKASLEPAELKLMVSSIRQTEMSLGQSEKVTTLSELENKSVARKSIVAARSIRRGESFTQDNLSVKRPGNGISPMRWDEVIGLKAIRDFNEDEMIDL